MKGRIAGWVAIAAFDLFLFSCVLDRSAGMVETISATVIIILLSIAVIVGVIFFETLGKIVFAASLLLFLWMGGDLVAKSIQKTAPVITIDVDNSVKVYPPPEDPSERDQWWIDKFSIKPGEGAVRAGTQAWVSSVVVFISASVIILLVNKLAPTRKGVKISVDASFLVVWIVISLFSARGQFKGVVEVDAAMAQAATVQWLLGLTQEMWWPALLTMLSWMIADLQKKTKTQVPYTKALSFSGVNALHGICFFVAAATWAALKIFEVSFNPTMLAWTICTQQVAETGMTAALCQQAFVAGKITAWAVSMSWAWFVAMVYNFLEG